ncbi:MAG: helix-turn-helix domain-containing protein [Saprospiraceae bacterium]|nr:helix-turn-helix domain-containing protein [Saprospiraceae bacterium]
MYVREYQSKNPLIKRFVEKYQLFQCSGPFLVKAIPSGTCECWVVLEGEFKMLDADDNAFRPAGQAGFFPLSSGGFTYFFEEELRCFNIKLKPSVLGLPAFTNFIDNWKEMPITDFLGQDALLRIKNLDFSEAEDVSDTLDQLILAANDLGSVDQRIDNILTAIFSPENVELKVGDLATQNHLTVKSFERLVHRVCGMTPKKLLSIIRFGKSSIHLKESAGARLIDALAFGYYDQSHFNKECKRLTKLRPKEFLSKLELNAADLVFEKVRAR